MAYIGNNLDSDIQVNKYEYTATAGQTTFACTYDRAVDVYINGVKLAGSDFTATNGTAIVLTSGANAGDIVDINAYFDVTYAGADAILPDQTGNTGKFLTSDGTTSSWGAVDLNSRVAKTGDTMTGALNVLVNDGDLKGVRTFHGVSSTYNPATDGTPEKIVSAVDLVWYSDNWRIGATRGGATDIQELMFVRNANSTSTKYFGVDSAGRVTMPYQPAFFALLSSHAVETSGEIPVTGWSTPAVNVGSSFNNSTGVFTAPVSGNYFFSFCVMSANTTGDVQFRWWKNGSIYAGSNFTYGASAYRQTTVTAVMYLAAGDSAQPIARSSHTTSAIIAYAGSYTHVSGYLIG